MSAEPISGNDGTSSGQFLSFTLGAEEYGVEILKVQEIRGYDRVTAIAHAPAFIKGVINLRGLIVPIVDLRIKFQVGKVAYDDLTVVVILNLAGKVVGVVVDSVSDVVTLPEEAVRPVPSLGRAIDTEYIRGLGSIDERMIILVDMERLMTSREMSLIEDTLH